MPFVKLDCGILNSTIWYDPPALKLFVTALLMAEPQEVSEPLPTIKVGSLEPGDYVIPSGWYGFVPSSGPGLVHRALMDTEEGFAALCRLSAPEGESRSHEHEGRRLVRVDGGFIVLNFQKYRDHDYGGAERTRRWRERQRADSVTRHGDAETRHAATVRRHVTQAEAEAEGEERTLPTGNGSLKGNGRAKAQSVPRRRGTASAGEILHPEVLDAKEVLRRKALESFEAWWKLYPRRDGKGAARHKWLKMDDAERRAALEAVVTFGQVWALCSPEQATMKPLPTTWLNQRRWEDDPAAWAVMAAGKNPVEQARIAKELKGTERVAARKSHADFIASLYAVAGVEPGKETA